MIHNPVSYYDRTVQFWHHWHEPLFGDRHKAIDIDLMGYCAECKAPLYLIESTTNPAKATSVIRALSRQSGVPAICIQHNGSMDERGGWIGQVLGSRYSLVGSDLIAYELHSLRLDHYRFEHPAVPVPPPRRTA